MRACAHAVLALAIAALVPRPSEAEPSDVPCEDMELAYSKPGFDKHCMAGSSSGFSQGDPVAVYVQFMGAFSDYAALILEHVRANPRTYVRRLEVQELIEDAGWVSQIADWGNIQHARGFDVRTFNAQFEDVSSRCIGFARHYGTVVGGEYRNRMWGIYCEPRADSIPFVTIDEVLSAITVP